MQRYVRMILRPVAARPWFFFAVMLLSCLPTIAFSLVERVRILHFIVACVTEGVATAYILSLIVGAIGSPRWRKALMVICLILLCGWVLLETGCLATTHTLVSDSTIALISETNTSEAAGFFAQYFGGRAAACIVGTAAVFFAMVYALRLIFGKLLPRRVASAAMAAGLIVTVVAGIVCTLRMLPGAFIGDYQKYQLWEGYAGGNPELTKSAELRFSAPIVKIPCVLNSCRLVNGGFDRWLAVQEAALSSPVSVGDSADFDVVVVVGESFIRAHSQLYGYYLPTNPRLTAECDSGRLIVFDDVTTTANFTTPSLRNLFNLNDLSAGEQWYEGVYFPLIMRKAGYEVYHYDNQTVGVNSDRGISRLFYSQPILEHVYSGVSDSLFAYDGDFLNYVDTRLAPRESSGKKLVIYHLLGQHFPASARYPAAGAHFTARDITVDRPWLTDARREEVADYDNATLYNDSIVAGIASRFAATPTVMFYFSDHGEDCWDLAPMEARNKQMPDDPEWVDRQYHIPFFVWVSPALAEDDPQLVERLRSVATTPFSLGDLGHMILGLCGVDSPYYKPSLDPLCRMRDAQFTMHD